MLKDILFIRQLRNLNINLTNTDAAAPQCSRYVKKIHIKTSSLKHVINAGAGDRPKDTRGKRTKTKTQFKREFLKSEDAAKKIIWSLRLGPVCLCYCELLFRSLLWIFTCFYHRRRRTQMEVAVSPVHFVSANRKM